MGNRPNLNELDILFNKGTNFRLAGRQYEEKTGASLPKDKSYTKHKSALAARAKEYGYRIVAIEENAIVEKTVVFEKIK